MEEYVSPYTGQVFTNEEVFRLHCERWPNACERNGLNPDGTSKSEIDIDALPLDFPQRHVFVNQGITDISDVPETLEELVEIKGVGESTARDVLDWLEEN